MKWQTGIICLILLTSLGCAATTYQPMGRTGGYIDFQLDSNTFRVTFRGNAFLPKEKVEIYLLYRCAEMTLNQGFDYFVRVDSTSDITHGFITTPGSYSATTYGYGYGYGTSTYGTYTPGQTVPYRKHGAAAVIKMFKGVKPENLANVYVAQEVKSYLEKYIER